MRKFLSALLVLVLVLRLLPVTASAAKGSCGDNLNWNLDESTGVLTISGTGPMY